MKPVEDVLFGTGGAVLTLARIVTLALLLFVGLLGIAWIISDTDPAEAHPGRTDATGCHDVKKDFVYKDGRVAKAGTRHCHAGGAAVFWGHEWSADQERKVEAELEKKRPPKNDRRDAP